MRKPVLEVVVPVLGAGLLLLGVAVIGEATREWLRHRPRATVAMADVDCEPPPGEDRTEFLDHVQYLASMPDRLRLLDTDLPARLADAFAQHPWVEKVERVEITPPQDVRVHLVYRTPVLAVPQDGHMRAVDRHGVLLPPTASTDGLPVYSGPVRPPSGRAGTPWGDEAVEAAARQSADARTD